MEYIKRISESDTKQMDIEALQAGHIFRFNHKYIDDKYVCDEYYFKDLSEQVEIENIINNKLNDEQALYVFKNLNNINNDNLTYQNIIDFKYNEFSKILNDFTILVSRAKMLNDCSDLDNIISIIKDTKTTTIEKMNQCLTITDICRFRFKNEDIDYLKNILKPYLF
jgi:hypothetical protein